MYKLKIDNFSLPSYITITNIEYIGNKVSIKGYTINPLECTAEETLNYLSGLVEEIVMINEVKRGVYEVYITLLVAYGVYLDNNLIGITSKGDTFRVTKEYLPPL
jgi:hypothetical protein